MYCYTPTELHNPVNVERQTLGDKYILVPITMKCVVKDHNNTKLTKAYLKSFDSFLFHYTDLK